MAVKPQVLEFQAQIVHAQAVGDGGVDFQGFLGHPAFLFRLESFQGAHIVQAVGELDDNHANVAGHGQRHFLEVFRLLFFLGFEFDLGELTDPVHQLCHCLAKLVGQGLLADVGVFNDIVQHGGHQAVMVHVHVGEVFRHCQGVGDVGFAGAAFLAVVGLLSVEVGAFYQRDLLGVEIGG